MRKNAMRGSDYSTVLATMLLAIATMVNVERVYLRDALQRHGVRHQHRQALIRH